MKTISRARDVMNPDLLTVADEMTTDDLARYLIEHEISGAPVVDSEGHLIGVVSMTDIGRALAETADLASPLSMDFYRNDRADLSLEELGQRYVEERSLVVRDVMTPIIYQVPATASARDVARLMIEHHIHRLVVTERKEPIGIITSMDLLRIIADQPVDTPSG